MCVPYNPEFRQLIPSLLLEMIPANPRPPEQKPLEEGVWIPPPPLKWHQRWRRGWRLIAVIAVVLTAYGVMRGGKDYRMVKTWRARWIAREALDLSDKEPPEKAIALLEKAATLSPNDPAVLRTMADFNEPRQDMMALYALRRLVSNGDGNDADRERLCRLAFDWGHPELAASETLRAWARADPETLEVRPLELSARWMAGRGQPAEAERRLRRARERAQGTPAAPAIEVALSRLLLASPAAEDGSEKVIKEATDRLTGIIKETGPGSLVRADALKLLASVLLRRDWAAIMPPDLSVIVKQALAEQSAATQKDPAAALDFRLLICGIDLALAHGEGEAIGRELIRQTQSADARQRLTVARWLNNHQLFPLTLEVCDAHGKTDRDWFTARLDALFALKKWDQLTALLSDPAQPLSAIVKTLFLYRVEQASGGNAAVLEQRRKEIAAMASHAETHDVLYVAGNFERTRQYAPALELYTGLQQQSRRMVRQRGRSGRMAEYQL